MYKVMQAKLGKDFDANAKVKFYIGLNGVTVDTRDVLKGQPDAEIKFINWKEASCTNMCIIQQSHVCRYE